MLVGFALRLALFAAGPGVAPERALSPDSAGYLDLARNLQQHHVFALRDDQVTGLVHVPLQQFREELGQREPVLSNGLRPEVFRTPGYPGLLASIMALGGHVRAALLVQCVLGAISVGLVGLIGRGLTRSPTAALIAAAIMAVNPGSTFNNNLILSETFFTVLLLGSLWLIIASRRWSGAAASGGTLGLAVLVRPVAIALGPAIALWLVVTRPSRRSWGLAAVLIAASLLLPAAWVMRNNTVGAGLTISPVPALNGYYYTAAHLDIADRGGDTLRDWPAAVAVQHQRLRDAHRDGEDVYATMNRLAKQRIFQDPVQLAWLWVNGAAKFFTDHSVGGIAAMLDLQLPASGLRDKILRGELSLNDIGLRPILAAPAMGFNALLALGWLIGVVMLAARRKWDAALLLAGVVVYFMLACNVYGLERFRLPVVGLQAIAAGVVVTNGAMWLARRRRGDPPVAVLDRKPLQNAA